jgi:hypothetical protein
MSSLSPTAAFILDHMEPNRAYEAPELRAFIPDASLEAVRETMHELWVERQVERFGYGGWRRSRSTCAPREAQEGLTSVEYPSDAGDAARQTKAVKPEDLFDHAAFAGLFKPDV